tara:strand:- start:414 stop:1178 length:765 start_codon:yes stop_codon:yes gene_type:complete
VFKEEDYILVLGSKPDSKLPDVKVNKIYSANGAAEKALVYKKKYPSIHHTALIGSKEYSENENVKLRVINSLPDRLYCRSGSIIIPEELKKSKLEFLTSKEQLNFQSKFYKFGRLDIILGEIFFYEKNLIKIVKHTYSCIRYQGFWGVATGFYGILLALIENPKSKIIVSGIGLVEGGHFYTSKDAYGYVSKRQQDLIRSGKRKLHNKFRNTSRCRVERYLIYRMKKVFKDRIVSVDDEMVTHGGVNKWDGDVF